MLKKIKNKFHTLPYWGGSKKYGKFHTFFYFIFETFPYTFGFSMLTYRTGPVWVASGSFHQSM